MTHAALPEATPAPNQDAPDAGARLARDDRVLVEHETGRFEGRVLVVRRDRGGGDIVEILTEPEGLLLTVTIESCTRLAA